MTTSIELRIAALEAAAKVYEGRGPSINPYSVIRQAQAFEHYVRTGQNIE